MTGGDRLYKDKPINISLLLDFYGDVLSEKQRETLDLFYNSDFSLSEIAENTGITRQGVHDRIEKSEKILTDLENKLGLVARYIEMKKQVDYILSRLTSLKLESGEDISDIIEATKSISL